MKRTVTIVVLGVALVVSNAWWAYQVVDVGVTLDYRNVEFEHNRTALEQAIAVLPVAARTNHTREEILHTAGSVLDNQWSFEKEGYTWIGELGFAFDADGRVKEIRPAWK